MRKIQTIVSLLGERSADRLSEKERDYFFPMTQSANRMQDLLQGLLKYSRVETQLEDFSQTSLEDAVKGAISDLEISIKEGGDRVEIGLLPTVYGDPTQLRQLFQNLIADAVKYRREEVETLIRYSGELDNGNCPNLCGSQRHRVGRAISGNATPHLRIAIIVVRRFVFPVCAMDAYQKYRISCIASCGFA